MRQQDTMTECKIGDKLCAQAPMHPCTLMCPMCPMPPQDKMTECKIGDKLSKFVPVRNDVLLMSVLRLMHNLSFDAVVRDSMVKNGMIPKASFRFLY